MGLDFDELFPARFLKAGEFKGQDVTLTIANIQLEDLDRDGGKKERKGIIGFKERPDKSLVLNKTNGLCIRGMFGRDTGEWIGKRITLFPAQVEYGDSDIAIRVRGSPDIANDITVEIKLARKKPRTVKMIRTGNKGANGKSKPVPSAGEPPDDVVLAGETPPPDDNDMPFGAQ